MGFRILFSGVVQHPNAHPAYLSSFSCCYHQVPARKQLEGYFGSQFEGLVSITVGKTWQKEDEAAGHGLPTVVSWEWKGSGAGLWHLKAQPQWPTSPSKVPVSKDSTIFQSNATPGHQALRHITLGGTFICRLHTVWAERWMKSVWEPRDLALAVTRHWPFKDSHASFIK